MELTVLIAANLLATLLRFVLMREWVFARRGDRRGQGKQATAAIEVAK